MISSVALINKKKFSLEMESFPDWAGLVSELLEQIAIRLPIIEDFTAFRGVCTSWRAAVMKDKHLNGVVNSKIPLLLLPEQDDGERELYNLFERRICGKVAFEKGEICFDVGFGWILAVKNQGGDVQLFKSLSRGTAIQLPDIKKLLEDHKIKQAVLSDDPTSNNFALCLLTMGSTSSYLCSWSYGEEIWTGIVSHDRSIVCTSICCLYYRIFYALDASGYIWTWSLFETNLKCDSQLNMTMRCVMSLDKSILSANSNHLVGSTAGELLLISRHDTFHFKVFELLKKEVRVSLRGDAIFLSVNSPTSVAAAGFPGVLPNCIYFANDFLEFPDRFGGKDMGIYNVENRSLEMFDSGSLYSSSFVGQPPCESRSPLWISPSF